MATRLDLILEAERRNLQVDPADAALLEEARRRNLVPARREPTPVEVPSITDVQVPGSEAYVAPRTPAEFPPGTPRRAFEAALSGQLEAEGAVIGEAPFKYQLGGAFGTQKGLFDPGSEPVRQMMTPRPGYLFRPETDEYEFKTVESEGPLKGSQLFRRKGSRDKWTTLEDPTGMTFRSVGAEIAGGALPFAGGTAGIAIGAPGGVPGMAAGGGGGAFLGEIGRQGIGQGVFGLQEPGRGRALDVAREVTFGALPPILGVWIGDVRRAFKGSGALPEFNTAQYREALKKLEDALASVLGPEEAKIAVSKLTAADVAAASRAGGILEAQTERQRRGAFGQDLQAQSAELERYLSELSKKLLGVPADEVSPTVVGRQIYGMAPQEGGRAAGAAGGMTADEIDQLERQGKRSLADLARRRFEEMTTGSASPLASGKQEIGERVAATAPRGTQLTGPTINPEAPELNRAVRADIANARANATKPLSEEYQRIAGQVGTQSGEATATADVVDRYKDILDRRLFPSLSEEDARLVNSFLDRAYPNAVRDKSGKIVDLGPIRPSTVAELRDESANLKTALRDENLGKATPDVRMLRDLINAVDKDIDNILRNAGREDIADSLVANNRAFKETMDLFERSGRLGDVTALRSGGRQVVADERVAGTIFGSVDNSNAVRKAFDFLPEAERDAAINRVRQTLEWEIVGKAAPGRGLDVNQDALENFLRTNAEVLRPWFSERDIAGLRTRAAEIAKVRRSMGVRGDTDMGKWFDEKFWNASADQIDTILSSINRTLPRTGSDSSQATIDTLRSWTLNKVRSTYTSRDEVGRLQFDSGKFFKDMMDNPDRVQFYNKVLGPEFAARGRMLQEDLFRLAGDLDSGIKALRAKVTTSNAQAEAQKKVADGLRAADEAKRKLLGVTSGNETKWFDERWNDANATQMKQIMDTLPPDVAEQVRNLTLQRIWKDISSRQPVGVKPDITARPGKAIDENKLMSFLEDKERKDWLAAVFGGTDSATKALDKMAGVLAMMKPDQAKVILTQTTDPALLSVEQARRIRNVVLGPLNHKSRVATRFLEFASDRIKQRTAEALLSPQNFLALQEASQRTKPGMLREAFGIGVPLVYGGPKVRQGVESLITQGDQE
jgi:hypothetical protein